MLEKRKITQQSDVSLVHCYAILLNDGTFFKLDFDYDTGEYVIYSFDVIKNTSYHDWIDLDAINSYSDTDYKPDQELNERKSFNFTSDVCSYYGAYEFDQSPTRVILGKLEDYINEIL